MLNRQEAVTVSFNHVGHDESDEGILLYVRKLSISEDDVTLFAESYGRVDYVKSFEIAKCSDTKNLVSSTFIEGQK